MLQWFHQKVPVQLILNTEINKNNLNIKKDKFSDKKNNTISENLSCPLPKSQYDKILLAHGGGGTLMHNLIDSLFKKHFDNDILRQGNDSAIIDFRKSKYAFTTDSYVVQPIFFPGGDIGSLAIYGTVNDLSVSGAKPEFISVGFIIEEGFLLSELEKIVISIRNAADFAGIKIVTGDTKVIDASSSKNLNDINYETSPIKNIYINTSGIGRIYEDVDISPLNCKAGDIIILSGSIAEHGIAIISAREKIEFETEIKSDLAPLNRMVEAIVNQGYGKYIRVMRDPTRGGVTSTLNEIAKSAQIGMKIYEEKIPILSEIVGACELFGFDPMYVANEGKIIAVVDNQYAEKILKVIKSLPEGKKAEIIGEITEENKGKVVMKTIVGNYRVLDMISGEQLPRIC